MNKTEVWAALVVRLVAVLLVTFFLSAFAASVCHLITQGEPTTWVRDLSLLAGCVPGLLLWALSRPVGRFVARHLDVGQAGR